MQTPKIIHQTWKDKNVPTESLENVKSCQDSNYEYRFYTDDDLLDVVVRHFPQYLEQYKNFKKNIERVDFARYAILYSYGGVYLDLDVECLKKLDTFISTNKIILGTEPKEHRDALYDSRKIVLCNAVMISPPKQTLWLSLMDHIIKNYDPDKGPVYNTGPMALTSLYEKQPNLFRNVLITSPCVFYPQTDKYTNITQEGFSYISKECNMKDATTIHKWTHTWVPKGKFDYIFIFICLMIMVCYVICMFNL